MAKNQTGISLGDRIRYQDVNMEVKDIWYDGMEQRAFVETLRGKNLWGVTVATLLSCNKKKESK